MNFKKIFWAMRALIYKFRFKKIGNLCYIGRPIFLLGTKRVSLGNRVRIYPHIRMETHNTGKIEIQDNVSIGQGLHITAGGHLIIGKNTTISSNVLITDIDHEFHELNTHIMDQPLNIKETIVGDNCFIGAGAKILPGTRLGKQCIIGANSVVKGNFPDYSVIVGIPAKIIKYYDKESNKWKRCEEK